MQHKGLAGVVSSQLTAEELGLTGDAESRALVGVLEAQYKLAHRCPCLAESRPMATTTPLVSSKKTKKKGPTCLVGKLLQSNRQSGEGLVSGAGLCDDGEAGGRAIVISGSNLDAGDGSGLVRGLG